jgi:hypothetical protein
MDIPAIPNAYNSAAVTQTNDPVQPGTTNAQMVRLAITTGGSGTPIVTTNNIKFRDDNSVGVSSAKLYYTTSTTFATTTPLGTAITTPTAGV